jgi:hypothetical protein
MPRDEEKIPGPIEGLRLPQRAWAVLQREHITTLDRLRSVADRLERFEGVGPKTALAIRQEIARARPRWQARGSDASSRPEVRPREALVPASRSIRPITRERERRIRRLWTGAGGAAMKPWARLRQVWPDPIGNWPMTARRVKAIPAKTRSVGP